MATNHPYVSFRCDAFNTTEEKPEFEVPANFGDDVASWFGDRLAERGWRVDEEIQQDDIGWYVGFGQGRDDFGLSVTALSTYEARWLAWVNHDLGFFGRLFGRRNRDIPDDVLQAVHDCLTADPLVSQIRWHTRDDFRRGNFEEGAETPCSGAN